MALYMYRELILDAGLCRRTLKKVGALSVTLKPHSALSASSQPTPKLRKLPLGAIASFTNVGDDQIEIINKAGKVLQLKLENLKPLMDTEDSQMKRALLKVHDKGVKIVVRTLQSLEEELEKEKRDFEEEVSTDKSKDDTIASTLLMKQLVMRLDCLTVLAATGAF